MRAEWDIIIQTSVTRGHQWHKALSSSLENSAVPRVLWGWETSTITTHSPLLTTWPSCWRTKSSSPLSPMSSSTWSDCLMKVSYDHDASRLCITHLGIGMLRCFINLLSRTVLWQTKGLFWKTTLSNSFCFLHRLSRRHPACLSPVRDQVPGVDKELRPDGDEELCSDRYHDIISTSESGGCDPLLQRGRVPMQRIPNHITVRQ